MGLKKASARKISQLFDITSINGMFNVRLERATTTNVGDSIKLTGISGSLSASNPAYIPVMSTATEGQVVVLKIPSDITLKLTGAHWGVAGLGDLVDVVLRVYLVNDAGTAKLGVALKGSIETVAVADSSETPANINLGDEMLVSTALGAQSQSREIGYLFASFDDTGGAEEDLWTIGSDVNDVVVGKSGDGIWSPWFLPTAGFSVSPTWERIGFCQNGKTISLVALKNANGTSNATTFQATLPFKAAAIHQGISLQNQDAGADIVGPSMTRTSVNSNTLDVYKGTTLASINTWTASLGKGASIEITYSVY